MAGIFGFLLKNDRYHSGNISKKLLQHAKFNFNFQSDCYIDDSGKAGLGFAFPNPGSKYPFVSQDKNYIFQPFGEIYLPDFSRLSELNFEDQFLHYYLKLGNDFIRQLRGSFIFSLFIKPENRFII